MGDAPLLTSVLPGLAAELEAALRAGGRPELADQVPGLRVRAACPCSVDGCGSFHTELPLKRWFRRGREVEAGDLRVNTIDGEIVYVEVLGRPDVRSALHAEVS